MDHNQPAQIVNFARWVQSEMYRYVTVEKDHYCVYVGIPGGYDTLVTRLPQKRHQQFVQSFPKVRF